MLQGPSGIGQSRIGFSDPRWGRSSQAQIHRYEKLYCDILISFSGHSTRPAGTSCYGSLSASHVALRSYVVLVVERPGSCSMESYGAFLTIPASQPS